MTGADYILEGLAQALELERELGVRTVEIDRALLAAAPVAPVALAVAPSAPRTPVAPVRSSSTALRPIPAAAAADVRSAPLVFLHDRPLSEKGVEMMAKIICALGRTAENAPVVVAPPVPPAKVVVVLGGRAMKKYFPDMRGGPGQWQKTPEGRDVLITYSPEYVLRFETVTPAVQKIKQDMWRSLKAVRQRLDAAPQPSGD